MCTDSVKSDDPDQCMNYIHLWKSFNLLNARKLYMCVTNLRCLPIIYNDIRIDCLAMPANETR